MRHLGHSLGASVRLRLILWNVLVLGLALIVTGGLLRQTVKASLLQASDTELAARARGFQDRWPPSPEHMALLRSRLLPVGQPEKDILRPRILAPGGSGYFTRQPVAPTDPVAFARCVRLGEPIYSSVMAGTPPQPIRVLTAALRLPRSGVIDAVLQVAAPLTPAHLQVALLSRKLLALLPIALLIAGFGAAFLTDRALRPVRAVIRAAGGISVAQDLSARLAVSGNDEFSQLASTFNGMVARLEETFSDLQRAYEQQRRFVADASHELRTPLTIIKANTSLALSDPDLDPGSREVLTEVDRAVDRTSRIVQDLFLLARSDSGRLPMDPRLINIGDLLREVCERSHYLGAGSVGGKAPVRIELPDTGGDALVRGDPNHLERLFTNLIENALRHTPADGEIIVHVESGGGGRDRVVVRVTDNGEGIAPDHLPRICERFYRVDSARARTEGGTGLGLAISEAIAEAHGGAISIESKLGEGTTVRVALPRADTGRV